MAQQSKHSWTGIGYINSRIEASGGVLQSVVSQLNVRSALVALAAALLSQAVLPGGAMPFCVPLMAAFLLLQQPGLPVLVGCAVGLLLRWQPISWLNGWQLMACVLLWVTVRKGWDWKPWKVSVVAGVAMLLPLPLVMNRSDEVIACLSGAVAAGLLTPVYIRALLAIQAKERGLTNDDKLCCLLVVAAMSLGALWIRVEMFCLGDALAGLLVFAVAWAAGPGLALPAGVLMGLALMTSGATFDTVAVLAVLGGLAGALGGSRRVMPLIGGLLGCALTAYAQGGVEQIIALVPSLAVGGALFVVMPGIWLDALRGVLETSVEPMPEADAVASAYILSSYAEATANMARALPMPDTDADAQPVELLACRLCTGCERQQTCWDSRRAEAMGLLNGVLTACAEGGGQDGARAAEVEQAARMFGCIRSTEIYGLSFGLVTSRQRKEKDDARRIEARAWALEQLHGQARTLAALSEKMAEGCAEAMQARALICQAMPALRGRPDALTVCVLDGRLHIWLDVQGSDPQVERLEAALGAAVGCRLEMLESSPARGSLLFVEKPRLRVVVGRAGTPIAGEDISGDSTLSERLDAGRHLVAISDGMGSGRAARGESRAALELLCQALRAGYGRGDALRTVNGLLVACRGDEMFATMDLCVIDLDSGEAALEKLGACPSFLLRAGKCKRIGGDALPMGILDAVRPRALAARLQPGDILLMVSDGVMDAFGGEEGGFLRALGGLSSAEKMPAPQRFADTLLRRAFERSGGTALDDMTVVAARVEEAS